MYLELNCPENVYEFVNSVMAKRKPATVSLQDESEIIDKVESVTGICKIVRYRKIQNKKVQQGHIAYVS